MPLVAAGNEAPPLRWNWTRLLFFCCPAEFDADILRIAAPALLPSVAEPLMSLADTGGLGREPRLPCSSPAHPHSGCWWLGWGPETAPQVQRGFVTHKCRRGVAALNLWSIAH